MNKPILWNMTDIEIIDELSRIEYHYGTVNDEGKSTYSWDSTDDRERAIMASALKRILILLSQFRIKNKELTAEHGE